MKILMVSTLFPPYFGGAAIQATYLAERLQGLGISVDFITDNAELASKHDIYKSLRVYRCSSLFKREVKAGEFVFIVRCFSYILSHWNRFDIIHFHSMRGLESLIYPLLKIIRKKVLLKLTLVGNDDPMAFKKRKKLAPLYMWGLKYVDNFVAISTIQVDLTELSGLSRDKVHHIPNGVDTSRYCKVGGNEKRLIKKKLELFCDKVFLTIGKVEDRKNHKFLLESWKYIYTVFPSSVLIFAGPGNTDDNQYYCDLQNLIREEDLQGVFFLGQRDDLDQYMKISDAFLFASKTEGFGTVLIEALVTGVPVVATNIEGVTSDIIHQDDNDLARICYSESPVDFADIVIELMQNYNVVKRDKAIGRFKETYSIDIIADRYIKLYHNMMANFKSLKAI